MEPLTREERERLAALTKEKKERLKAWRYINPTTEEDARLAKEHQLHHETPLTNEEMISLAQRLGSDVIQAVGVSLIISPASAKSDKRVRWYPGELELYARASVKGRLISLQRKIKGHKNFQGAALCLFGLTFDDIKAMYEADTEFDVSLAEAYQYGNYFEPIERELGTWSQGIQLNCLCDRCNAEA